MAFFQVKTLPGHDWPLLPDSVYSLLWAAYLELDRTQWLPAEEIERRQLQQVRTLLAHSIIQVPYYRRVLPAAGIVPGAIRTPADFRLIPLLPRRTCQDHHADLTATSLPPGTQASGHAFTSGASGTPIKVWQTNWVDLWWCACYLRDLEWCGIQPTGTIASIRGLAKNEAERRQTSQGIVSPCWLPALEPLIETGPAYGLDVHQDPRRQVEWLGRLNPDYLLSYPSNLEALAGLIAHEHKPFPKLRSIQTIAEVLPDETRARLEAAFGVPVKNTYSCCEAGYVASPCPQGHGLHVHGENVMLEVLDEAGQPCLPGQTGQVYLTTLQNFRAPFLRYEVGDEAVVGPNPCPCGRGLPLLSKVLGKRRPMFHLPGGRLKNSSALAPMMNQVGGHHQHQIIQKSVDHVLVRLVPQPAWDQDHDSRLRKHLQEFFEGPVLIDVELTQRLELPLSGKFQSIICEVATI